MTESVDGSQRALAVAVDDVRAIAEGGLQELPAGSGLVGCAIQDRRSRVVEVGAPAVTDALSLLTRGRVPAGRLRRHAASFFQANRFLIPDLVLAVMDAVGDDGPVLDLYAGVGLFSMALAASGRRGVVAVEGDRMSGADLEWK